MNDRASPAGPEIDRDPSVISTDTADLGRADDAADSPVPGANPAPASADAAATPPAADPQDAKEPVPTLQDAVRAALQPKAKEADPSTAASKDSEGKEPAGDANKDAKPGEAKSDQDVPFHNHPRWKQVVGERDAFKADAERFKPAAEQYDKITSYMSDHKLTGDEVGEGFVIMAMLKAGTEESLRGALAKIEHYRDNVLTALGEKLPEDLQAKVDRGLIDDESAKEVARSRAASASAATSAKTADEAARKAAETAATETQRTTEVAMQSAVVKWEAEQAGRDPKFAQVKRQLIRDRAQAIMNREFAASGIVPKSPDDAVALTKRAHDELARELGWIAPVRKPTATTKTPTSRPASTATAAPAKSLQEAIRNSLAG